MSKNIRTLEVFNTLDAYKRKEFKLIKESAGLVALTTVVVMVSSTLLPETVGVVPAVLLGTPLAVSSVKKAREADTISNFANVIFEDNKGLVMDYVINGGEEHEEFSRLYPSLSKHFKPIRK